MAWYRREETIETSGREDGMFSPFIGKPFQEAVDDGLPRRV